MNNLEGEVVYLQIIKRTENLIKEEFVELGEQSSIFEVKKLGKILIEDNQK